MFDILFKRGARIAPTSPCVASACNKYLSSTRGSPLRPSPPSPLPSLSPPSSLPCFRPNSAPLYFVVTYFIFQLWSILACCWTREATQTSDYIHRKQISTLCCRVCIFFYSALSSSSPLRVVFPPPLASS